MNTQSNTINTKPRIRCRHYTPTYEISGAKLLYIRAVDDKSCMASHLADWEYIARVACEALAPDMTRFHPRNIVQRAITLPSLEA
jgi:hypothetical protein